MQDIQTTITTALAQRRAQWTASDDQPAGTLLPRDAASTDGVVLRSGAHPAPREATVLFCGVVGSQAQGLATDASDLDLRGCYLPGFDLQFGLNAPPEQLQCEADQLCLWEISKCMNLALRANPTVLEALYSPHLWIACEPIETALRDLIRAGSFLSARVYDTFRGYADSQFQRMARARERGVAIKWQHAMHLIRLLEAGRDLLDTGTLTVTVPAARRDELLAIKRGDWSWEQVNDLRQQRIDEFEEAAARTPLPPKPDFERVDAFVIATRRMLWELS